MGIDRLVVVCDLDGVLFDCVPLVRKYLLNTPTPNWEEYYRHTHELKPIIEVVALINSLLMAGSKIIFASGRPESLRKETLKGLWKYLYFTKDDEPIQLHLRKLGDTRPSGELKLEVCDRLRKGLRSIETILVLEDEPAASQLLTTHGYRVLQVQGTRCSETDAIPQWIGR